MIKEILLNELKSLQLNILQHIHEFCLQNGIKYSICGGTLLGAIRHKGYIPWDDDIDIMMLRDDYEKFISLFNTNDKHYKVYTFRNCDNYNYSYAKVSDERTIVVEKVNIKQCVGVNIDVFPLDHFPDSIKLSKKHVENINKYIRILQIKQYKKNIYKNWCKDYILFFTQLVLKAVSEKYILKKIDKSARKFNSQKSNFVGCLVAGYGIKERCINIGYNDPILLDFENYQFYAIRSYHAYLTNIYGNYMELPPKDQQVSHHLFEARWK